MTATTVRYPMRQIMAEQVEIHFEVTGQRIWKLRTWLGLRLLGLAAWVFGCPVHVSSHFGGQR